MSAQYGAPTGVGGGLACVVSRDTSYSHWTSIADVRGLLIGASGGSGGGRLELGYVALGFAGSPYMGIGFDGRVNVTRTWDSPQGASPNATYVGVEAGVLVTVVRLSAGVAQRVVGPAGAHGTVFTWSAGIQLAFGQ